MDGKLIIFSAPSGSGKTTIVHHLLETDLGLAFSISATSRKPRSNENEGVDYYFLDPETFRYKIENGSFLEWEEVYENQYYGTLRTEVERLWKEGKHVLFDIDVVGGLNLKKIYGHKALAIFVQPPSLKIMEKRLRKRGSDSEDQIMRRIAKAKEELAFSSKFDFILINDSLEKTLKEAEELVREFILNNNEL